MVYYGVAQDICDEYAIEGCRRYSRLRLYGVSDAMKPIRSDVGAAFFDVGHERRVHMVDAADRGGRAAEQLAGRMTAPFGKFSSGPTEVLPEVAKAQAQPMIGRRSARRKPSSAGSTSRSRRRSAPRTRSTSRPPPPPA